MKNEEMIKKIKDQIHKLDQKANHWDSKMQDCWDFEENSKANRYWNKVVKAHDKIKVLKKQLRKLELTG